MLTMGSTGGSIECVLQSANPNNKDGHSLESVVGDARVSGFDLGIGVSTLAARYHDFEVSFCWLAVTNSVWSDRSFIRANQGR